MKGVGIDVGKAFLDVAVHDETAVQRYPNTRVGIRRLLKWLVAQGADLRIIVEATGGYEEAVLEASVAQSLWIARGNPRSRRGARRP